MKIARIRELSKMEGNLRSDGYVFDAKIIRSAIRDDDKLIITIKLRAGDIKRITNYWSCVRVLARS